MHLLLMIFAEDAQAQAALTTLGMLGLGPISVIAGIEFNGGGGRHPCIHALCFLNDEACVERVRDLLTRTVRPPVGPFARWAIGPRPAPARPAPTSWSRSGS